MQNGNGPRRKKKKFPARFSALWWTVGPTRQLLRHARTAPAHATALRQRRQHTDPEGSCLLPPRRQKGCAPDPIGATLEPEERKRPPAPALAALCCVHGIIHGPEDLPRLPPTGQSSCGYRKQTAPHPTTSYGWWPALCYTSQSSSRLVGERAPDTRTAYLMFV